MKKNFKEKKEKEKEKQRRRRRKGEGEGTPGKPRPQLMLHNDPKINEIADVASEEELSCIAGDEELLLIELFVILRE